MALNTSGGIKHCQVISQQNGLDDDAVNIFIANHSKDGAMWAFNRSTSKVEPIRNKRHLERLLVSFCQAYERQKD